MQNYEGSKSLAFISDDYWCYINVTVSTVLSVLADILQQYIECTSSYHEREHWHINIHYDIHSLVNAFIVGNLLGVLRHWWFQQLDYVIYDTNITSILMKTALELRVAAYVSRYVQYAVTRLLESLSFETVYMDWEPRSLRTPDPPLMYVVIFLLFNYVPEEWHAFLATIFEFLQKVTYSCAPSEMYSYSTSMYTPS
ncbi:uncharacterized protein LOC106064990 isoform X1 [Biomphalaria glabrata]|uniref:Uncharacterized protein LOC106064990 isoform X1 n=1 Tax=Biomphalaria glabrata TaxID=6526 RepID=A0A9U8EA22_BIOGL|nr:uncharacterized protein LOC106064990 isoform X1 [Biomphalaria glabrata]